MSADQVSAAALLSVLGRGGTWSEPELSWALCRTDRPPLALLALLDDLEGEGRIVASGQHGTWRRRDGSAARA